MSSSTKTEISLYPTEKPLFYIAFVIAALVWMGVLIGTFGLALLAVPVIFFFYVIAQSGFVSYLKGSGALVSSKQFPEIQAAVESCAKRVGLKNSPNVYVMHMDGMFNAFALRFLRKNYVVLLSDIVDAMDEKPDALRFYIGHEMGHLHRNHTLWETFLAPALVLPLLGAAYSRSREYTCDSYGAACCEFPESARYGLAALAVGGKKYTVLNNEAYLDQLKETKGFWMSFHELIGNYPWLVKRFARAGTSGAKTSVPSRNPFAYILAIFVPRLSIMSAVIIYLLFIGATAATAVKSKMSGLGEDPSNYSSYQEGEDKYDEYTGDTDAQQPEKEGYIVGEIYEGDNGRFFKYLGGDPHSAQSWQETENPSPDNSH